MSSNLHRTRVPRLRGSPWPHPPASVQATPVTTSQPSSQAPFSHPPLQKLNQENLQASRNTPQPAKAIENYKCSMVFTMSAKCHPGPLWVSFGHPRHPKINPRSSKMSLRSSQGPPKAFPSEPKNTKVDPKVLQGPPKVTNMASIVWKKHAKVTQKASKVWPNTPLQVEQRSQKQQEQQSAFSQLSSSLKGAGGRDEALRIPLHNS